MRQLTFGRFVWKLAQLALFGQNQNSLLLAKFSLARISVGSTVVIRKPSLSFFAHASHRAAPDLLMSSRRAGLNSNQLENNPGTPNKRIKISPLRLGDQG